MRDHEEYRSTRQPREKGNDIHRGGAQKHLLRYVKAKGKEHTGEPKCQDREPQNIRPNNDSRLLRLGPAVNEGGQLEDTPQAPVVVIAGAVEVRPQGSALSALLAPVLSCPCRGVLVARPFEPQLRGVSPEGSPFLA